MLDNLLNKIFNEPNQFHCICLPNISSAKSDASLASPNITEKINIFTVFVGNYIIVVQFTSIFLYPIGVCKCCLPGDIGWLSPAILKPAFVICDRNRSVFSAMRFTKDESAINISKTYNTDIKAWMVSCSLFCDVLQNSLFERSM